MLCAFYTATAFEKHKVVFQIDTITSDTLIFSMIGYETYPTAIKPNTGKMLVKMKSTIAALHEVNVYNTGYRTARVRDQVGAVDVIGTPKLERSLSKDMLSRIENLSPGMLFNYGQAGETDRFLVRGRSTISADARPLIVLDNFPYEGDIENINPNDIESVSILKDASAASIWGARAANGVIVMTSKKGRAGTTKIELRSSLSVRERPDLNNISRISSSDLVDLTKELYAQGVFAASESGTLAGITSPIPQAVEILIAGEPDMNANLEALKNNDVRKDISKYLYAPQVLQQYNLSLRGGQEKISYFLTAGYDQEAGSLRGTHENRINLRSNIGYALSDRIKLDFTTLYTRNTRKNGHNTGLDIGAFHQDIWNYSSYDRLVDQSGNPTTLYPVLRKGYIDTVGNGRLLDWNYSPVAEIEREEHINDGHNLLYATGLNYRIMDFLHIDLKYQYENQRNKNSSLYKEDSYYARHHVNMFSQLPNEQDVIRILPVGAIYNNAEMNTSAHQFRSQLNLDKQIGEHHITGLAGYEIRHKRMRNYTYAPYYGYNTTYNTVVNNLNYETYYPILFNNSTSLIQNSSGVYSGTDNFLSYYGNLHYNYNSRYFLETNIRRDEANLFGVATNQKGTPLWSIGAAWDLSREQFYKSEFIPYLKTRISYGANGNISRATSAYTTMSVRSGNSHRLLIGTIQNPPNENLRWEQVKMLNIGVEFGLKNQILSGRIDLYNKNSTDLLALIPTDATYGFSSVYANSAEMNTKGIEVQLNGQAKLGPIRWNGNLNYSYNKNKVTKYLMPIASAGNPYVVATAITPLIDHPLYAVFSYPWAGLHPETGRAQGLIDGQITEDYASIYNMPLQDMHFHGPLQSPHYGNFLHTFSYGKFAVSFNISYRFGGYFRAPSLYHSGVRGATGGVHGDYARRWQQPGDELNTYVPVVDYTVNTERDFFYRNAQVHVYKSDVVRLEDINSTYSLRLGKKTLTLIANATQLGMLWTAAPDGIDPYFVNTVLSRPHFSFGANLTF